MSNSDSDSDLELTPVEPEPDEVHWAIWAMLAFIVVLGVGLAVVYVTMEP